MGVLISFGIFSACSSDKDEMVPETIDKETPIEGNPFEGRWRRVKTEYPNETVYYEDKNYFHVFSPNGNYSTIGYSTDITEEDNFAYGFDSQYLIIYYHPEYIDTFKYKFVENDVLEYSFYNANHNLGVAYRQSVETLRKVNYSSLSLYTVTRFL